ncbi:MAG: hypothetical protein LUG21_05490 [Clostridiales bacterium]|nr:hypothetical protein [Clostridiales bacterium]
MLINSKYIYSVCLDVNYKFINKAKKFFVKNICNAFFANCKAKNSGKAEFVSLVQYLDIFKSSELIKFGVKGKIVFMYETVPKFTEFIFCSYFRLKNIFVKK